MIKFIYLDNNATAPILPEVLQAMHEYQMAGYGNSASQHWAGRRARQRLEESRATVAEILGANTSGTSRDRVIFTSGGTEANNLAIRGLVGPQRAGRGLPHAEREGYLSATGRVVISSIEHPSVQGPARFLEKHDWDVVRLGVDRHGVVSVSELHERLTPATKLVSVMLGNNETGVIQPVAVLASICRRAGVLIHTDAAQVVGKLPVHFRQLGVDAVSISAHKFHGPPGIGALIVRDGVLLEPLLLGGHQQGQLRPGSEAVALAVGMAKALAIWHEGAARRAAYLADLRDRFERQLIAGWPDAVINGAGAQRLPHTSNIGFAGVDRQALFMALDMASVACSTGSACASGSSERSAVLRAMGCEPPVIAGSLRFSFGALNTPEEVDEAVKRILKALRNLRRRIPARKSHHAPPAAVGKSL